ncbi:hypothetical protein NUU61_005837 [Penicillium alfredii]|uniref:Uncharacterized protein n=1 Tax=Penicillium alfredii TaxID=1506179 RepID=A0A9W9K8J9_9EURO|nr:uncharacterized protein NUU61_005837 [Penicillium alfredii]KAJ5096481.1 hypothetical protein NUU61_005837 [Penicillium alfredii]
MDADYFQRRINANGVGRDDIETLKAINPDPSPHSSSENEQPRSSVTPVAGRGSPMIDAVVPRLPDLFFVDHPEPPLSWVIAMDPQIPCSSMSTDHCLPPSSRPTSRLPLNSGAEDDVSATNVGVGAWNPYSTTLELFLPSDSCSRPGTARHGSSNILASTAAGHSMKKKQPFLPALDFSLSPFSLDHFHNQWLHLDQCWQGELCSKQPRFSTYHSTVENEPVDHSVSYSLAATSVRNDHNMSFRNRSQRTPPKRLLATRAQKIRGYSSWCLGVSSGDYAPLLSLVIFTGLIARSHRRKSRETI